MTALKISILGSFQVSAGKTILNKFESNKVRALFAYLVSEMNRPHSRESLAELLWPDSSTQSALANLRYALADLRKVIGDENANPPCLIVSRENLQFNAGSNYELDAASFTALLQANDIEKLRQGIALYQGDFLAGFPSIESDPFEEWVVLKREQFKRQAVEALRLIVDHHEGRGEYQRALPFARRQVELEPWLEEAHQQLMRLLALDGQRSAALAQYESCRRALDRELDVEPTQETIQLYKSIRDGNLEKVPHLLKREPPAPGDPPFKGLQYFDEKDADLFFGREDLVSHLVEQIRSREKMKGAQFLAIIGASGSGKSSLVRAGLIPALKRGGRPRVAHIITPTEHPLEALSSKLKKDSISKEKHLLFVDQFEELFTLCQSEKERKSFINNLLHAAQDGSTSVVIALRADFYAACAPYENLRKILSRNQEYIGPMNADELRRAIEEPARAGGWTLEPGLVDLFLHDIGADGDRSPEPGALPLLSHALLETWHRRSGRMLTLAGYAESGKIHEAIAKTAEAVFARFSPQEQSIARNIFLRLTELGEGTQETRRRVLLSEIIPPLESTSPLNKTTETVLKMLSDARLVTTTEATAEVAHEALIREWNRLHEWLTENREGLRLHRHITESAQEWEKQERDQESLYRGTRLAQALEWADSHSKDLNSLEREFLETSKALTEREFTEREAQRQRELEAARKLAESERQRAEGQTRSARQLRRRAYVLVGILLLALVLAVAAILQRNSANRQTHLAAARELALASVNNLNVDAELSTLLALQAVSESDLANVPVPYEVQDALHQAIQNSRIHYTLAGHAGEVLAVAYSQDGKLLATAGRDTTAKLWDAATGTELVTLRGHSLIVEDVAFSPDGKILATASDDKTVKLWDVESWKELRTLDVNDDVVWNVSFSADGKLLATAGEATAKMWNVDTGQLLLTFEGQYGPVAFSPVGNQLATSSNDGTTKIWDVETGAEILSLPYAANILAFSPDGKRLATANTELKVWNVTTGDELVSATGFTAIVRGIAFNPDGSQIATGGQDGTVILWDSWTGKRLFALAGHAGAINDVAFSPQCVAPPDNLFAWCGVWLATASRDGTAKVWDVSPAGSRELITMPGFSGGFLDETHLYTARYIDPGEYKKVEIQTWIILPDGTSNRVSDTIFDHPTSTVSGVMSADGTRLATIMSDNTVKVWDIKTGEELSTLVISQTESVRAMALNSNGTQFVTGDEDGTVKVWEVATGKALLTFIGNIGPYYGVVAFSPDGTRIATGGDDGIVRIWDPTTGKELLTLAGHTLPIMAISFSTDGKRIATAGMDQTARVWDAASGENLFTLTGHTATVLTVAFSPDGTRLVTGSHDGTARVWDISDDATAGQELLTLTGHDGWIDYLNNLSFSRDGKRLATGSWQDGTVRVYVLDVPELVTLAQSRLTRSFTLEECQKYLHQAVCP
jgi:WD40 repeat protein/DNA-binding SARP family transcriptional activator/energy-coupling factor transporter ATP-binding protein EcfA2